MDWLTLPFSFPFMRDAALIGITISIPAGLMSCYLVLKGWSLMGDAVSHAILPGVVIAYMIGAPLLLGAFVAGMICSLATGFLQTNSRVKQDTVLGVVMSGMFGLGVVLYTQVRSSIHLDHILFGNMLGVGPQDLALSAVISAVVVLALLAKWRDFALLSFDPVQARVAGLPVTLLHYRLLTMLSLTVVSMLSAVGIILSVALLIAPGAIAFLITRSLGRMLVMAVVVAVSASLIGVWASFWLDSSPAATIVLLLTLIFIAAFVYRQIQTRRLSAA
ncbi:metal ABC transporter permease [Paracoccus aminophilus]|uniref:Manganese/iron transport system, permease protein n=1 Tax=Paracoccus aminophilus JCM 7686 TaxID=1367847 RepID=S5XZ14_PARAH|nr:metal ABC transporter permease [Paracoccus aminophilus]AGT08690.1 manganese/iron transport system, permease protein [Paracoccus aminophilus JCM 7686]